jgi:hypothetical protein
MTSRVGFPAAMDPFALDPGTADRLATGAVDAGDAPPEYRAVARTLQALRSSPESSERAGERAAVERIAAAVVVVQRAHPTRRARRAHRAQRSRSRAARLGAAAVAAGVLCLTGGFASAGSLPEPAQNAASAVLGTVGISVPTGGDEPAGGQEPPTPASNPSLTPSTGAGQPSPGASQPGAGAPPAAAATPAAPGNGQGELDGKPADGTPSNAANGHDNDHSPNGSPPAGAENGKHR